MKITLNGQPCTLDEALSITELLSAQGFEGKTVAVAVNNTFVPKSAHEGHVLQDNDRVEVVAPMQGG